jgi:hypothetical protein
MNKILISISNQLASRLKAVIPPQLNKVITHLIVREVEKRKKMLYDYGMAIEKDQALHDEMKRWDITLQDGRGHGIK